MCKKEHKKKENLFGQATTTNYLYEIKLPLKTFDFQDKRAKFPNFTTKWKWVSLLKSSLGKETWVKT